MKIKLLIIAFLMNIFLFVRISEAQQTVFNVPSADVTEEKKFFMEGEAQFRAWRPDPFFLGTSYNAYGIGKNTELDVTLFNVSAPASNNITLGTGFKSAIPIPKLKDMYPKREYKITIGSQVLSSLEGQGAGNWTYSHLSGRVPKLNTRITGGVSYGTKQVFGENTTCFIGAIEQPVTPKIDLLSDWYSGNEHFAGFLISGFCYKMKNNKALFVGYQIPNSSQAGKSGFAIEFAKTF